MSQPLGSARPAAGSTGSVASTVVLGVLAALSTVFAVGVLLVVGFIALWAAGIDEADDTGSMVVFLVVAFAAVVVPAVLLWVGFALSRRDARRGWIVGGIGLTLEIVMVGGYFLVVVPSY